jgi:Icc-related predicted phosphoesterase
MPTTLAVIGDIHGHLINLEQVVDHICQTRAEQGVDGVLLVGDIGKGLGRGTRHSREQRQAYVTSLRDIMHMLKRTEVPVLWVPGNHDVRGLKGPGNIDGRGATIGELDIVGIGGAGPDKRGLTYEWDEEDILALDLPRRDVLLSHTPPHDTAIDWVPRASHHAGSTAIRARALETRGFLVCGHIHESPGAVQLGDCLCMNVGGLGRPFGRAQVGYIRRSDDGDEAWHVDLTVQKTQRWTRTTVSEAR